MRLLWLPFCCILAGMTHAYADSYRDRDDGFDPLNVMQGMPNPMNMFDSSDRRWDERHRRPPPPGVIPGYGYPTPPGYGLAPPVPMAPYYAVPPAQPALQAAPPSPVQPSDQAVISNHPEPTVVAPYGTMPPPVPETQTRSSATPEPTQPAYQFRPVTPLETAPAEHSSVEPRQEPTTVEQHMSQQLQEPAETGEMKLTAPYSAEETPLVNGQPAVFRPMHLGVETPPSQ
jgi:hypothetical protein